MNPHIAFSISIATKSHESDELQYFEAVIASDSGVKTMKSGAFTPGAPDNWRAAMTISDMIVTTMAKGLAPEESHPKYHRVTTEDGSFHIQPVIESDATQ